MNDDERIEAQIERTVLIGLEEKLDEPLLHAFVLLMLARFPGESSASYIREWAVRMKTDPWGPADDVTSQILEGIKNARLN